MVLGMLFFTLSNANIQFTEKKLTWRSYIAAEALPITKQVEIIDKIEFAKAVLNENVETFVVYVISIDFSLMSIYPAKKA